MYERNNFPKPDEIRFILSRFINDNYTRGNRYGITLIEEPFILA